MKDITFDCDICETYDYKLSSMSENRSFLYWLTARLDPKLIVELGTYYGCSFFAFTQAIKDHRLSTYLMGVDTWKGDEHSLFYGEEVMGTFQNVLQAYNTPNTVAYQDTFDNFADNLKPDCIDVLLIDGLHTYEASKNDFETYLPKLNDNAVVLFHDIKVQHFTLKEYWSELKALYPHIEIDNQFGMGVLFPKGDKHKEELENILSVLNSP